MVTAEERLTVLRAQSGDAEAFAALVAARRARLLVLVAATIGDWHEAEDALQDALWRAFTAIRGLRAVEGFDAWLRQVVLNAARDHLRSTVARIRREGEPGGSPAEFEALLATMGRPDASPGALPEDRESCTAILQALATLPPLQRRAGRLAWVAGVEPPEVARLLGVSGDSAHAALHRARRRLAAMFYTRGDWRRDVDLVSEGAVRVAGYRPIATLVDRLTAVRPDLQVADVDLHAPADLRMRVFWAEAPGRAETPPAAEEALPLDGLADAAGFDLEPFGRRLARFTVGGRLFALPHHDVPHLFLYNAELLQRAGLPLPRPDWTWDEFFGYCRRCAAAGMHPINAWCPGPWEVALVAEQLGASRDHLDPVREAVSFVRDWRAQGWTAPDPVPDWAFGQFLDGGCVFFIMQYGHSAGLFRDPRFRPFPWGVAPVPRFRRSDPPVRYWCHYALQVPGTAADPTAAFQVAQGILTHGPVPELDDLPAYRTPQAMAAWRAQPLPLGKECLLDLDTATDPLYAPVHFFAVPGAAEALVGMLEGQITPEEGLTRMRAGVAAHRAGERVAFPD